MAARTVPPVLVSMAAGTTIAAITAALGGNYPVIRIMPNTPAAIGEGMILYTVSEDVTEEDEQDFLRHKQMILEAFEMMLPVKSAFEL